MNLTIDDLAVLDRYFSNPPYRSPETGRMVRRRPDRSDWKTLRLQFPPGLWERLGKLGLEADIPGGALALLVVGAERLLREG